MSKNKQSIYTKSAVKASEQIIKAMEALKKISKEPPFMTEEVRRK